MKIKTCKLEGKALDWVVAEIENTPTNKGPADWWQRTDEGLLFNPYYQEVYSPSTLWAQGGLIIEAEMLTIGPAKNEGFMAWTFPKGNGSWGYTPLMAAMRCYVASKLGNIIDIPEELL
jgi:hypothetical protein